MGSRSAKWDGLIDLVVEQLVHEIQRGDEVMTPQSDQLRGVESSNMKEQIHGPTRTPRVATES